MRRPRGSARAVVLAAMVLVATGVVYFPVTRCFFHDDDFVHLYIGVNEPWRDLLVQQWGGHMIALFSFVVAGMLKLFGPRAEGFYSTILVTHLLTVGLLFVLVQRLTRNPHAAAIAALLWGTSPVHAETLGWFSVYGQLLATIAMVLAVFLAWQEPGMPRRSGAPIFLPAVLVGGALAYGIGIGVALVFPLVAWSLTPPGVRPHRSVAAAAVGAATVIVLYHVTLPGTGLAGMATAFGKRSGVLLSAVVANTLRLLAHGVTRLHLGPFGAAPRLSSGILLTGSAAWVVVVGLGVARTSAANRRQMAGLALLAFAIYLTVAIGRSIIAAIAGIADMGNVGRYHYAAMLPLAALTALALTPWLRRTPPAMLDGAVAVILAVVVAGRGAVARSIPLFPAGRAEAARVMTTIEQAAAGVPVGGTVRIPNRPFSPAGGVRPGGFPGWAAVFAIWSPSDTVAGRRVVFVEQDPTVVATAAMGRRSASLLVAP